MSPPLPSRTLLVRPLLTMLPTSCNETMASTPTATQKIASRVRCPPRPSERVAYDQYSPSRLKKPMMGSLSYFSSAAIAYWLLRIGGGRLNQAIHDADRAVGGASDLEVVRGDDERGTRRLAQ